MLGITNDADGGTARLDRASGIAERILTELSGSLERVASAFSQAPRDFDEPSITSLLEHSGLSNASHRALLSELA
jgi:hypothetical protein